VNPLESQLLLIGAVAAVGVFHTLVPDHWVPIAVLARQRGWSQAETARAAAQAGTGHIVSTLAIAVVVWFAGVTAAKRYGAAIDTASSMALIGFGLWIAISAWREEHRHRTHSHPTGAIDAHRTDVQHGDASAGATAQRGSRTALLLIVGSSPMVEGIPVFFAAGGYGVGMIGLMATVFAATTIATYVLLCVSSASRLQSIHSGAFERHGEALSGATIAIVGLIFWVWPFSR
jgi:ABC-type nickel/cobalt efflux system permease component RcnA